MDFGPLDKIVLSFWFYYIAQILGIQRNYLAKFQQHISLCIMKFELQEYWQIVVGGWIFMLTGSMLD